MEDSGIDSGDHNGEIKTKTGKSKKLSHFRPSSDIQIFIELLSDSSSGDSICRTSVRPKPPLTSIKRKRLDHGLNRRLQHHQFYQQDYCQPASAGLIPIQRLPIPGAKDQHRPLVQWDSDDSEEDIVNFFPLSRKESRTHQELSDTFSIEEMSISGEDDEEDDLHLVPPQKVYKKFACCSFRMCTII